MISRTGFRRLGLVNILPIRRQATDEKVNYAFRKELIAASPAQHYPTIRESRSGASVIRIPRFISQYLDSSFDHLENRRGEDLYHLEGRVKSIRRAGRGLYFIDVVQDGAKVQIYASNKILGISKEEFSSVHAFIRKGDFLSCSGYAYKTNVGELSLQATSAVRVVSPCLNSVTLPDAGISRGLVNSHRVMNYLVDDLLKQRIRVKSLVTQAIRTFLVREEFLEVQTPILAGAGTGANAEPFVTELKALHKEKLQLRVAPELWLKKLVIGGFDKVFEIGMNFRNEGIDATHSPEFLTCEFYRSFTSLPELMTITESLLKFVYFELERHREGLSVLGEKFTALQSLKEGDFPKYEFIPTLERRTGVSFPAEISSESLIHYIEEIGLEVPSQTSTAQLLDYLSGEFLESISTETPNTPIFIYNQPAVMSPLAKSDQIAYGDKKYEISLRFELFINGREYVNSYEEENSPFAQQQKFMEQQRSKAEFNDHEAIVPDWNYVQQMEFGLPPTGGWGCGIDRLSMLFSDTERIEDVLTFGTIRDVIRQ